MEKGEMDMKQRYDKKISNTYYPKMAEAQNDGIIFYSLMFPKIAREECAMIFLPLITNGLRFCLN